MTRTGLAVWLLGASIASAAPPAEPLPEWRYTLRPGDTLIGVSQHYLARPGDWRRVQQLNRIADPYRLVPGSSLRIPLAWLKQTPAPAAVAAVSGSVRVTLPGGAARALNPGESLYAGARLDVAANSSATLRLADGSMLRLQPGTRLTLDTVSVYAGGGMVDTRLRLQQGRVEVGANPRRAPGSRLQVITPSAVAAVRGTQFRVAAGDAVTQQETLAGEVTLDAAGQQVAVLAGHGSVAEAGKPPSAPVALLPAPDLSRLPTHRETLPLAFEWPALPDAAGWLAQVAPDARFESVLLEWTGPDPRVRFADLPDGDYVLRVRAIDARGLQGRDAELGFTVDARPFAPLLTAPGERIRQARPVFVWSAVVGADAYRFQLASADDPATPLAEAMQPGTQWQPAEPLAPGAYLWRVASVAGTDAGPFSPPRRLVLDPLPGAPDLTAADAVFREGGIRLQLPPPPPGLRYDLTVSADAAQAHVLWRGESRSGQQQLPLETAPVYLGARLVEADGTAGPTAVRRLDPPPRPFWEPWLVLLPLLFAL
ncbi:MAG: FecR domain-containing protein [Thiobacillus sp.]|nr:FecR domain-containing protein [Thiobacillus sp.]